MSNNSCKPDSFYRQVRVSLMESSPDYPDTHTYIVGKNMEIYASDPAWCAKQASAVLKEYCAVQDDDDNSSAGSLPTLGDVRLVIYVDKASVALIATINSAKELGCRRITLKHYDESCNDYGIGQDVSI